MTITWQQARDDVRADLWRQASSLPDSRVDRSLHAAIREIEGHRNWLWLEDIKRGVGFPDATDKFEAPADLAAVISLQFVDENEQVDPPLMRANIARVRELQSYSPGLAGWPREYAWSGPYIYLDRAVRAGSQLELVYQSRTPPDLVTAVAAGDENVTLGREADAVKAGAARDLALGFLKNQEEGARQALLFDKALERLEREEDAARGDLFGGLIVPDDALHFAAHGYC